MKHIALFMLMIAAPVWAQTAKVYELTPEEAAQAKQLYAQKAEVEAKISKLRAKVAEETYPVPKGTPGAWDSSDIEFSEDYRFAVPATLTNLPGGSTGWIHPCTPTIGGMNYIGPTTDYGGAAPATGTLNVVPN